MQDAKCNVSVYGQRAAHMIGRNPEATTVWNCSIIVLETFCDTKMTGKREPYVTVQQLTGHAWSHWPAL